MSENEMGMSKQNIILFVAVVIILCVAIYWITGAQDSEKDRIGEALCLSRHQEFWYTSGGTVHCEIQDNNTAIRQSFSYWVDWESAKKIYLGEDDN